MKNKNEEFGQGDTNETVVGDLLQILRVISTPINLLIYRRHKLTNYSSGVYVVFQWFNFLWDPGLIQIHVN